MEDPPITMPGEPIFGGRMGEMGTNALRLMTIIVSLFRILPGFIGKPLARGMMPGAPDEEIVPWLDSKKRLSGDFLSAMKKADDMLAVSPFQVLEGIRVPALLIMGDRDEGAIVSTESAQEMSKVMPDLQIAHLQGANHDIRRRKFGEYVQALRAFLSRAYGEYQ
jgi:pimeloyl-ACP methyl ester carboxylesterase